VGYAEDVELCRRDDRVTPNLAVDGEECDPVFCLRLATWTFEGVNRCASHVAMIVRATPR